MEKEICSNCNGLGYSDLLNRIICFYCRGTGEEMEEDDRDCDEDDIERWREHNGYIDREDKRK